MWGGKILLLLLIHSCVQGGASHCVDDCIGNGCDTIMKCVEETFDIHGRLISSVVTFERYHQACGFVGRSAEDIIHMKDPLYPTTPKEFRLWSLKTYNVDMIGLVPHEHDSYILAQYNSTTSAVEIYPTENFSKFIEEKGLLKIATFLQLNCNDNKTNVKYRFEFDLKNVSSTFCNCTC